jgi:hypothetical protein
MKRMQEISAPPTDQRHSECLPACMTRRHVCTAHAKPDQDPWTDEPTRRWNTAGHLGWPAAHTLPLFRPQSTPFSKPGACPSVSTPSRHSIGSGDPTSCEPPITSVHNHVPGQNDEAVARAILNPQHLPHILSNRFLSLLPRGTNLACCTHTTAPPALAIKACSAPTQPSANPACDHPTDFQTSCGLLTHV